MLPIPQGQIHIRFQGESYRLEPGVVVPDDGSDAALLRAVASWLEVDAARLDAYVVERHENGNVTIRPEAVFG